MIWYDMIWYARPSLLAEPWALQVMSHVLSFWRLIRHPRPSNFPWSGIPGHPPTPCVILEWDLRRTKNALKDPCILRKPHTEAGQTKLSTTELLVLHSPASFTKVSMLSWSAPLNLFPMSFSPFLSPSLQLLTLPSGRDAWREPVEICRITNRHWKCTGARVVSNISNIALQKDGMEEIHHQTIINGLGNTLHTNTSTGNINSTKHYQFGTLNQGFFEIGLETNQRVSCRNNSEHTSLENIPPNSSSKLWSESKT